MMGTTSIGIAGLGVIGGTFALNIADHGFSVVAYDTSELALHGLELRCERRRIRTTNNLEEFTRLLDVPRTVMVLVPAGPPTDRVIDPLKTHLTAGDLIIDAGNPFFRDTDARAKMLAERGIDLLGVGISDGDRGAGQRTCLMIGGPRHSYERARSFLECIAAEVNGEPCVAYLGPGSAGHYVEMVHDGIEHGIVQLIGETYDLMTKALGRSDTAIQEVYGCWGETEVGSRLLEIVASSLHENKGRMGATLFEVIVDEYTQSGGGRWASLEARELDVPTPTIDVAIAIQMLLGLKEGRIALERLLNRRPIHYLGKPAVLIDQIRRALCAGLVMCFDQGVALLRAGSNAYKYDLAIDEVARVWRGSIIRCAMLNEVYDAFYLQPQMPSLLSDSQFAHIAMTRRDDLRATVRL